LEISEQFVGVSGEYKQIIYETADKNLKEEKLIPNEQSSEIVNRWIENLRDLYAFRIIQLAHSYEWWDSIPPRTALPVYVGVLRRSKKLLGFYGK